MKVIKIYDEDAETLDYTAAALGVTGSDLASMIFSEHFAKGGEGDIPETPRKQEPPSVRSAQDAASSPLMTPKELAEHFRTTPSTILSWYHDGTIPAEVAEGKVYRFDLRKVSTALICRAGRAAAKA